MFEINLSEVLTLTNGMLGSPKTCTEALAEDSPLDKEVAQELDKLVSVLIVEIINHTTNGNKLFSNKITSSFLYYSKNVEGIKRVAYAEWISLSEFIDGLDLSSEEYEYFKLLISLNSRRQFQMSASLVLCYLINNL